MLVLKDVLRPHLKPGSSGGDDSVALIQAILMSVRL